MTFGAIESSDIAFFWGLIGLVFFGLLALAGFRIKFKIFTDSTSPYTGFPLRRAKDLPYESAKKILLFLYEKQEYDNRIFKLKSAVYCRETGRIFTNCITWYNVVHLDWNFLNQRFPGHYVSWGSLSEAQGESVRNAHYSLEGFQTKYSSPNPAPSQVEPEYVYAVPGPLYVDLETKVLLGWQRVPQTPFEVLIVQKPK